MSSRIGVKIYKGSPPNLENIKKSLDRSFDLKNFTTDNPDLQQKILHLKEIGEKTYVWAGIDLVKIKNNDLIIFVNKDNYAEIKRPVAYVFTLISRFRDEDSEIRNYVDWKDKGGPIRGWKGVVFLKDKKEIPLSDNDLEEIEELTNKGKKLVLYGEEAEKIKTILSI